MSADILDGSKHEDDAPEITLRPRSLSEFQGQEAVKDNLRIFIQAARERRDTLDHVFLSGPPGVGKTTLAGIMAQELGAEFKVTGAPALEKPKDLAGILTSLSEGAVFFIDEIHRLRAPIEEMLYIAMEDFELDWIIGQGPAARAIRVPLPRFTLVGATTKPGSVSAPLMSRFGISLRIGFYAGGELESIVKRSAAILEIVAKSEAIGLLAECSRGTPRVANRLLRRARDFAQVIGDGNVTPEIVREALERLGIDRLGLGEQDRRILATIIDHYGGGPVGAETLAISIGEGIDSLEDYYEPYLIQRGLIKRTPRGRVVTEQAYRHLGRAFLKREDHGDQGLLL